MIRLLTVFILMPVSILWAQVSLRYAENFSISHFDTHKEITVRNTWKGAGDAKQVYALVHRGDAIPELEKGTIVIRTPVKRLVIMATVFVGPVHDLDLYDSLKGVAYLNYVNDPRVHELVAEGRTKPIQSGTGIDVESMLMMEPDLILTSTTGNATFDVHPQMVRAGLPVVVTASYMETHPLARTEWLKFFAAFYDKEPEAEEIFNGIAERYESLVRLAKTVEKRPTVFASAPFGGTWHMPAGNSYTATAFRHAGADFLWKNTSAAGSLPLDFEAVLERASNAEFWLNPSHYESLNAMLGVDERFVVFEAFQNGRVFNNTKRVNEHGGNDIFERGVSHPDEVLADLVSIFHPELLPEHEFVFYEQLK